MLGQQQTCIAVSQCSLIRSVPGKLFGASLWPPPPQSKCDLLMPRPMRNAIGNKEVLSKPREEASGSASHPKGCFFDPLRRLIFWGPWGLSEPPQLPSETLNSGSKGLFCRLSGYGQDLLSSQSSDILTMVWFDLAP